MSTADDILNQIPFDQVASLLGIDPQKAEAATREALPALLAGLDANAQDPAGAKSLESALSQHDNDLPSSGGQLDLSQVDTADGEKIVANVFGANEEQVVQKLDGVQALSGGGGAAGAGVMGRLLPLLAPLVMTFLAKRVTSGGGGGGDSANVNASDQGGGGLSDLLSQATAGAGGITDLLGGLLGGGRR